MEGEITVTVKRVAPASKYMEFWVEEDFEPMVPSAWDWSDKAYKVWEAVEEADLYVDILNHGFVGIRLVLKREGIYVNLVRIEGRKESEDGTSESSQG